MADRTSNIPALAKKNIASIAQLEQEFLNQRSPIDRISDAITQFAGSMSFISAHALWFFLWIGLNVASLAGLQPFDPYPFMFLNLAVSLEVVFLSTFVLMSQNRQNRQAEHWAHLHLQVALLAEQETTKMLEMLKALCVHHGLEKTARDRELAEMMATTHVDVLADELQKARAPEDIG